jgi:hypothetical protein
LKSINLFKCQDHFLGASKTASLLNGFVVALSSAHGWSADDTLIVSHISAAIEFFSNIMPKDTYASQFLMSRPTVRHNKW